MTDERRVPLSPDEAALDEVVRESKTHLSPPEIEWAALEARVMDRIAEEPARPLTVDLGATRARVRVARIGAIALAAAAAVLVVVRKDRDAPLLDAAATAQAEGLAGSLRATEGAGEVRVAGLTASAGQALRVGDVLEADGARAIFERQRAGGSRARGSLDRDVTWLFEKDGGLARARVKGAAESLVLGLDDGAIEAQVMPVAAGEAFAVDVAAGSKIVRIAVHGTHLRVGRNGARVTVDLSEGVVSIGVPPRTGSTYGALVTAPAHVEFDATDLDGTLRIDHTPSSVRAPIPLGVHEILAALPKDAVPAAQGTTKSVPPPLPTFVTRPPATVPTDSLPRPAGALPAPKVALPPRDALAAAVRDCASARSRPGEVRVTVTSTLKIHVGPTGEVETAQFDPPLLPEIQTCAAGAIYKVRLEEPGLVSIPIQFSY